MCETAIEGASRQAGGSNTSANNIVKWFKNHLILKKVFSQKIQSRLTGVILLASSIHKTAYLLPH